MALSLHEALPILRGASWDGRRCLVFRVREHESRSESPPNATLEFPDAPEDHDSIVRAYLNHVSSDGHHPAYIRYAGTDIAVGRSADSLGVVTPRSAPTSSGPPEVGEVVHGRDAIMQNRVVLITGGAQGFGREIARGLSAAGAQLILADINPEGAERTAEELNARDGRSVHVALGADVSDERSVEAMYARITELYGGVDMVVSNAGVLKAGSVKELSADHFDFVTRVNYRGFFLMAKYGARLLASQNRGAEPARRAPRASVGEDASATGDNSGSSDNSGSGSVAEHPPAPPLFTDIIEINSKSGLVGSNRNAAYAGSKFGGIGLVQSFALELIEDNIKVNAICPGNFFDGPLWSDPETGLFVQYLRAGKVAGATTIAEVKRAYEARVPMGRGCTGADVVRAILYVAEQHYETGQAIPVTGGQEMLR